jgi:hypothetical protein
MHDTFKPPEGFETLAEAKKRRARYVGVLNRGNKRAQGVAQTLGDCRKDDRCWSEPDPVCLRMFRQWLVKEASPIIGNKIPWTRASVIPAGMPIPYGELHNVDLPALIKCIIKRFERSSLRNRKVIGGIDISLNIQNNVIVGWQLHLYLLIEARHTKRLEEAVKATFPPEPTAPKPHDFLPVTDVAEAVTYVYKSIFYRRSRYANDKGQARTWPQSLKGSNLRELLTWLDQYSVGCRLILRGVRRNGRRLIVNQKRRTSDLVHVVVEN